MLWIALQEFVEHVKMDNIVAHLVLAFPNKYCGGLVSVKFSEGHISNLNPSAGYYGDREGILEEQVVLRLPFFWVSIENLEVLSIKIPIIHANNFS